MENQESVLDNLHMTLEQWGLEVLTLHALKKIGLLYLWFYIHGVNQSQIVYYCSTYLVKKNLHTSGPVQVTPVLFNGQLYIVDVY